ncbi:MAG: diacylglycerol/lipid kinase family protein [bacterium]|jgi:diacylglycerol kinase (ATP)
MRTIIIINPAAGRGKAAAVWQQLRQSCPELVSACPVSFTERPGHARELAAAAATRYETIVSIGGDGTVHEIVNGIAGKPVRLVIVPAGTGNDLARILAVPPQPAAALRLMRSGHPREIDLGRVDGVWFMNVSGVGFDAEVVSDVNSGCRFPGGSAYILSVLKTLFRYRPAAAEITVDGVTHFSRIYIASVANGQYYGGGMRIAPQAALDDGMFDVCVVRDLGKIGFLRAFPTVFKGEHTNHPAVSFYRGREVRITTAAPLTVQADGEVVGRTPVTFTLVPRSLTVLVP